MKPVLLLGSMLSVIILFLFCVFHGFWVVTTPIKTLLHEELTASVTQAKILYTKPRRHSIRRYVMRISMVFVTPQGRICATTLNEYASPEPFSKGEHISIIVEDGNCDAVTIVPKFPWFYWLAAVLLGFAVPIWAWHEDKKKSSEA